MRCPRLLCRFRVFAAVLVAFSASVAIPPDQVAAQHGWYGPVVLSLPGEAALAPTALRETDAGDLIAAWESADSDFGAAGWRTWLNVSILRRGQAGWIAAERLELPFESKAPLALQIASDGRVAVIVPSAGRIVFSQWSPVSGRWSDLQVLAIAGGDPLSRFRSAGLSFDDHGGVIGYWQEDRVDTEGPNTWGSARILAADRSALGVWSSPVVLGDWKRARVGSAFAGNDHGDAVIIDTSTSLETSLGGPGGPDDGAYAYRHSTVGGWTGPVRLAAEGIERRYARWPTAAVSINQSGRALAVWQPVVYADSRSVDVGRASFGDSNAFWSTSETIPKFYLVGRSGVLIDDRGGAVLWHANGDATVASHLDVIRRAPGGAWEPGRSASEPHELNAGGIEANMTVTSAADGTLYAFSRFESVDRIGLGVLAPQEVAFAVAPLFDPPARQVADAMNAIVTAEDQPALTWVEASGLFPSLPQAACCASLLRLIVRDPTPPTISDVSMNIAAKALHGDAVVSDRWPGTVLTWDFDDLSPTARGSHVDHMYAKPGHYQVRLTATDSAGNVTGERRTIVISSADTKVALSHLRKSPRSLIPALGVAISLRSADPIRQARRTGGVETWSRSYSNTHPPFRALALASRFPSIRAAQAAALRVCRQSSCKRLVDPELNGTLVDTVELASFSWKVGGLPGTCMLVVARRANVVWSVRDCGLSTQTARARSDAIRLARSIARRLAAALRA